MDKEKELEPNDKEQSARFLETAERIGDDNAEKRFEEAMKRIAKSKPSPEDDT